MDNLEKKENFHFTYSAKEQEELKSIRQKYMPREEDKMQRIRDMDTHITNKAIKISIIIGVAGLLIMGIGMCCCMVWQGIWFIPGIIIGVVGMATIGMAYPVNQYVLKKEREKNAAEILRLTDELIK